MTELDTVFIADLDLDDIFIFNNIKYRIKYRITDIYNYVAAIDIHNETSLWLTSTIVTRLFPDVSIVDIYRNMRHKDMELAIHYCTRLNKGKTTIGEMGLTPEQISDDEGSLPIPGYAQKYLIKIITNL